MSNKNEVVQLFNQLNKEEKKDVLTQIIPQFIRSLTPEERKELKEKYGRNRF